MSPAAEFVEHLNAAWNARWPFSPPIPFLLRSLHPDRWVRFHSLPESKRYPETDAEYATLLLRHHAVLDELGAADACVVLSARFADDLTVPDDPESLATVQPGATHWRTFQNDDYFVVPAELYASRIAYPSPEFDSFLRAAADDQLAHATIGPPDLRWLYHPYDGGADVIAESPFQRDQLRSKFAAWLSSHPAGL
jgi:hypothetical protein